MKQKLLQLFIVVPLLMAFQCDDDDGPQTIFQNTYKVTITPQSNFSLNDTVWVRGRVSSMAFDSEINDSILTNSIEDTFNVYKLGIGDEGISNCFDAIDQFEVTYLFGDFTAVPICENAILSVYSDLNEDETMLEYLVGFRPVQIGDFVFSWNQAELTNSERNEWIINPYLLPNRPGQIGFNKCGTVSSRFLDESEQEYYFRVNE